MHEHDTTETVRPLPSQSERRSDGPTRSAHAAWIAGRVQTLLSHYYQPDHPLEVAEAAIDDWIAVLIDFSRPVIERACDSYIRDQPRRRPTPGDIAAKARGVSGGDLHDRGDKSALTFDQRELLETSIIPTARRWLFIPGLHEHARKTLAYWGEV
jgi:hypothetical protein